MSLQRVFNYQRWLALKIRGFSTRGPLVDLKMDNDGVSIMTLQRPPVNSLNLDLLKEMSKTLDEVGKNKSSAMILTSAFPNMFSAGLDINEFYKPDIKRLREFWSTLQEVWIKLFGATFVTAAAINGQAFAGGSLLAASCEYRVMTRGKSTIGMNETSVGLVAPSWFMDVIRNIITVREAEYAFTTARMFNVEEAFKVGLIDDIASDKDDAIAKCKGFFQKFDNITPSARMYTKMQLRQAAIKKVQGRRQADIDEYVEFIKNPETQKSLELYIQMIRNKSE